jgi:N,N-dimethylformamidase beta subunit-like, C-terminal
VAAISQSFLVRSVRAVVVRALCKWCPGIIGGILYRRRRSHWYQTTQSPGVQRVWGYADVHSIAPGGSFHLMLSTGPDRLAGAESGHIEISRVGFYSDGDRELVFTGGTLSVEYHRIHNSAASLGPNWPVALTVSGTEGWRSGYHSIDFVYPDGVRERDVAFVVVTAASRRADVVVKLATSTYQAYNRWGGHNLYPFETPSVHDGEGMSTFEGDLPANMGGMVSFDRPTTSEFYEWEYDFVLWLEELAERAGFRVAYTTNYDYAMRREAVDCGVLISVGHDEYWSKEEFDRYHERIFQDGGNTLFLGANTAYWQVRYVDVNAPDHSRGRQMVCHKSLTDPITHCVEADPLLHVTARFRDGARRPETMLLGLGFQSNLVYRRMLEPKWPYRVVNSDLPFFRGTGLVEGDFVGNIIGHEWDNRDPEAERPAPGEEKIDATDRLWHETRSKIDPLPLDRIKVVFAGEVRDVFGDKGRAEAVYYESDAGAKVFCAGTNRWSWGLRRDGFVEKRFQRFNENLILDFLER